MAKIVYNACYGGFGLSRAAVLRARQLSGNPKWGGACIKGDLYDNGESVDRDYGCGRYDIERHDHILVAVVEELGRAASGECARLEIEYVPDGALYRIDEYDGRETVMTRDVDGWTIAE